MKKIVIAALGLIVATALVPDLIFAKGPRTVQGGDPSGLFRHIGTFDVMAGNGSAVAEIVDVTVNGKQLVYTDSEKGEIGFVDISDPANPVGQGVSIEFLSEDYQIS